MCPLVILSSPKSKDRFKPTILLSKDILADILLFGHSLPPDVFPGKRNVKVKVYLVLKFKL